VWRDDVDIKPVVVDRASTGPREPRDDGERQQLCQPSRRVSDAATRLNEREEEQDEDCMPASICRASYVISFCITETFT